jgi:hypothetical protein
VLLKVDAHGAFLVKAHGFSLAGLLSKDAWCCGHRGRRDAGGQDVAPVRFHDCCLPDRCYGVDCKEIVTIVTPSVITPPLKAGKRMEALWKSGRNRAIEAQASVVKDSGSALP